MAQTRAMKARPAAKGKYQRKGQRENVRRYPPDGQEWGTAGWPDLIDTVPASGATAGIPGTWTPAGATPPADLVSLMNGNPVTVVASPLTPWTSGQYVQTRTTGAPGRATWTGTAWVGGAAPLGYDPTDYNIDEVKAHVNGLAMDDQRAALIQAILDLERANKNRGTLVTWLDQQLGVV
jgi:hypothetical protein